MALKVDDLHDLLDEPMARLEGALASVKAALEATSKAKVVEMIEAAAGDAEDALDLLRDIDPDGEA